MMRTHRTAMYASALALITLALTAAPASAHTHEFVASIGPFEENFREGTLGISALAVDLETGNVYVADPNTSTIDISGAMGGPPVDGVPPTIPFAIGNARENAFGDVAVDNSCYEHQPRLTGEGCEEYDPSYGDVYVVYEPGGHDYIRKYRLNAKDEYELVGELLDPFVIRGESSYIYGLTVDPRGNLYIIGGPYDAAEEHDAFVEAPYGSSQLVPPAMIVEFKKTLTKIGSAGKEETEEKLESIPIREKLLTHWEEAVASVAVDSQGDLYVGRSGEGGETKPRVLKLKLDEAGGVLSEELLGKIHNPSPVAVEPVSGTLYVGYGNEVQEYNAAGEAGLVFGLSEPLGGSLGKEFRGAVALAVNGPAGLIYVANPNEHDVDVFGPVVEPPVVEALQPPATGVTQTSALVQGSVDPESKDGGSCYFEYAPAGEYEPGGAEPYREGGRTQVEALAGGHAAVLTGQVVLSGLLPGTLYHYRVAVHNVSGTVFGPDETFTTAPGTPPVAGTGAALEVSATGAVLSGTVAPQGLLTSYVFEVGTSSAYEGARLFGSAGSGTGTVSVSAALEYLVPGTTYHYRLSATSFDGTSYGVDGTFTTQGVPSSIVQPAALPLIASPTVQFPSIVGAITQPVGKKPRKKRGHKARAEKRSVRRARGGRGRRGRGVSGGGVRR